MTALTNCTNVESFTPSATTTLQTTSRFSVFVQGLLAVLLILASVFGYGWWRIGSMESMLPWLMGHQLLFSPTEIEMGMVSKGQIIELQIRVTNLSSNSMKLLGSQKSCGCIALDEFPIELSPYTSRDLQIKVATGTKSGDFGHTVKFFGMAKDILLSS